MIPAGLFHSCRDGEVAQLGMVHYPTGPVDTLPISCLHLWLEMSLNLVSEPFNLHVSFAVMKFDNHTIAKKSISIYRETLMCVMKEILLHLWFMSNVNNMASARAKIDFCFSFISPMDCSRSEWALQEQEAVLCSSVCFVVLTVFMNEKFYCL